MAAVPERGLAFVHASPRERVAERPWTVIVAMSANLVIAGAKFVVAAASGSAAMFAEGVHSLVDTLNQGLLLVGVKRAQRSPDNVHPFGYGKEVYVWSLIYSVLLFGVGGGASIIKGATGLLNPTPTGLFTWSYLVLGVAALAEGGSWWFAVRAIQKEPGRASFWRKLKRTTDPARFIVVGEDSAALAGLALAFAGILLTELTGSSYPDSVASILIGVVLCAAAVALISKTMDLLVGQASPPEVVRELTELVERTEGVVHAGPPLTMHLGPGQALAALDIRFESRLSSTEVAQVVDRVEGAIRRRFPEFTRIYVEAQVADRDIEIEQPPPEP